MMDREFHPLAALFPLLDGAEYDALSLPFDLRDQSHWQGALGQNKGEETFVFVEPSYQKPYFYVTWGDTAGARQRIARPVHLAGLGAALANLGIDTLSFEWHVQAARPFDKRYTDNAPLGENGEPQVYFIEGGGLIKIGVSLSPRARLRQMQTMSPVSLRLVATMPGGFEQESVLHTLFASSRSHGEWFHETPELIEYIRGYCSDSAGTF